MTDRRRQTNAGLAATVLLVALLVLSSVGAVALTPVGYGLLTVTVIAVAVTIVATYGPDQLAPTGTSSGSQGPDG